MKTAVIGTGRTGGEVVKLLPDDEVIAFDIDNPVTVEKLSDVNRAIIFVPGEAAEDILDIILESGVSAVWGTTGFQWPPELPDRVKVAGSRWIVASNFSLGMQLVRRCLNFLGQGSALLDNPDFHIHEVHHTGKKDAPSGTALSWKEWLGTDDVSISSSREGDVKGIHSLQIKTPYESLYLKHEAHDRAVFAEGAIWAANYLTRHPEMIPGLYSFESIVDQAYKEIL